jgi:hypothetical protein
MFYEVGDEVSFEIFEGMEVKEFSKGKIVAVLPALDPEDSLPDYLISHEGKEYRTAGLLVWVPYVEADAASYDPLEDFNYVGSYHHY